MTACSNNKRSPWRCQCFPSPVSASPDLLGSLAGRLSRPRARRVHPNRRPPTLRRAHQFCYNFPLFARRRTRQRLSRWPLELSRRKLALVWARRLLAVGAALPPDAHLPGRPDALGRRSSAGIGATDGHARAQVAPAAVPVQWRHLEACLVNSLRLSQPARVAQISLQDLFVEAD